MGPTRKARNRLCAVKTSVADRYQIFFFFPSVRIVEYSLPYVFEVAGLDGCARSKPFGANEESSPVRSEILYESERLPVTLGLARRWMSTRELSELCL